MEENWKGQMKEQSINAKPPKLQITKFKGMHTDWLQFWNQFKAEIDSTDVEQLLEPKVRASVDSLPFTTEGYERAKKTSKTDYGKKSEIVNPYLNNIVSLPSVHGANPNKILEFYQKLSSNLQPWETMGK